MRIVRINCNRRKLEFHPRWKDVPRGTMDEVSSSNRLDLPFIDGKAAHKIVPPRLRIPYWKGPGANSEEKHEPASDIDTVVVDSLNALDPKRPIREATLISASPRPASGSRRACLQPCAISVIGTARMRDCPLPSPPYFSSRNPKTGRNCWRSSSSFVVSRSIRRASRLSAQRS